MPLRDPLKPYEPDGNNFGPRVGFRVDAGRKRSDRRPRRRRAISTVRTCSRRFGRARQTRTIPFRIVYNRTEVGGAKHQVADVHRRRRCRSRWRTRLARRSRLLAVRHRTCRCPTRFSRWSVCSARSAARWPPRSATSAPTATISRCSGSLRRRSTEQTGARPNPALGAPGGYYVDSSQTMVYNGLQTSLRKRFSNRYSWDVNYTLGKSESTQGGDLSAYYIASLQQQPGLLGSGIRPWSVQQRHPSSVQRLVHLRAPGDSAADRACSNGVAGWLAAFRHRAGAIGRGAASSRSHRESTAAGPTSSPGVDLVVADWKDTCDASGCNYLNTAGFVRVPVSAVTNATLRPGTYMLDMARGPGARRTCTRRSPRASASAAGRRLQVRADVFNVLNRKNYNNPAAEHQQRELRPDHRRRAAPARSSSAAG